jgi:hypothetical protein
VKVDDHNVAESVAMTRVAFVLADDPPTRGLAKAQGIAAVAQNASNQLTIAEARGLGLHGAHELASYTVTAEGTADEELYFGNVIQPMAGIVGLQGRHAAGPIADIGHQDGMAGIFFGSGDPKLLLFERAGRGFESGQAVLDGFIKDFAQGGRIGFAGRANGELWSRLGCSHDGTILAPGAVRRGAP